MDRRVPCRRALCDIDQKGRRDKQRQSYLKHIPSEEVAAAVRTSDCAQLPRWGPPRQGARRLIICVPTPLTRQIVSRIDLCRGGNREGDRSPRAKVASSSFRIETGPGTNDRGVIKPFLSRGGLRSGRVSIWRLAPQREDPRAIKDFATKSIPKVVGGSTIRWPHASQSAMYGAIVSGVFVPVVVRPKVAAKASS